MSFSKNEAGKTLDELKQAYQSLGGFNRQVVREELLQLSETKDIQQGERCEPTKN